MVNDQFVLRFVNRDNTSTFRNSPPIRESWVMFLDFPLDLQTDRIVDKVVGTFGRLLRWSSGPCFRGRVLAKAIFSMVEEVPSKIVIKKYSSFGGVGRSWTVSVFVLNGDFADVQPADEDLPPVNHIPLPDPPLAEQQPNHNWDQIDEVMADNNNNEEAPDENSHNTSVVFEQDEGELQIIPVFSALGCSVGPVVPGPSGPAALGQVIEDVMSSFLVFPQFWKLLMICNLLMHGPTFSGLAVAQPNALVPYQMPIHHVLHFSLLASALIWAKENWNTQQTLLIQPINMVPPEPSQDSLDLPVDPFLQSQDVSPSLPPKPKRKKSGKVVLVDSDRRRSARINKINDGYMSPDPKLGVGKPRGKTKAKSTKRLKALAEESGILFSLNPLPLDFCEPHISDEDDDDAIPADCSIQLL